MTPVMDPDKKGEFSETDPFVSNERTTKSSIRRIDDSKKSSWLDRQKNRKTWYFGIDLKWALYAHIVGLVATLAGHIATAVKGGQDTVP